MRPDSPVASCMAAGATILVEVVRRYRVGSRNDYRHGFTGFGFPLLRHGRNGIRMTGHADAILEARGKA